MFSTMLELCKNYLSCLGQLPLQKYIFVQSIHSCYWNPEEHLVLGSLALLSQPDPDLASCFETIIWVYPNKTWKTKEVQCLLREISTAFRSGDRNTARAKLKRAIKMSKNG